MGAVASKSIMFERFADGARRATALAATEARQLGHDFIGTEHLLLGLLALGEGAAFDALSDLEVAYRDVEARVSERVHPSGRGSTDSPPFTPLAKKALERALRAQLRARTQLIETEHLLLGLVDVPDGGGARILSELAGDLDEVRQAVLHRVGPPPELGREQTKAPLSGRSLRRWVTHAAVASFPAPEAVPTPPSLGESGGVAATGPSAGAPSCPSCDASLAETLRYRLFEVPGDEPGTGAGALSVRVVFCARCGRALGTA
ncbi:MAG TPA: Clp protease N-terminal domain-containing protein [Acidimicrobiales bacterium]|jgi:hypothetical protein|nr:Clp protease N-terminal domain-containing protein [Acidimicrobiales bacterium]